MELISILEIGEWLLKHVKPSKLLILVEDNSDDALILVEDLKGQNIKHELAKTAEDALLLMRRTRFHAALIDLGLPGMDGFTLATKIREKGYKTRIFFTTGSSFVNLTPGQHLNIIRKPIAAIDLVNMIL